VERVNLLGVEVTPLTTSDLNNLVAASIAESGRWIIANHNLHSIYIYHRDPMMREFYAHARAIHIDGMPMILWGKILGYSLKRNYRVTPLDWLPPLLSMSAQNGWRIFYLGGKPGVAEKAAEILFSQFPTLQIRTHHGYFSAKDNALILRDIKRFRPHILMVGMGMPLQEYWILANLEHIHANVILNIGALFDYIAGAIPFPPRWIGKSGFEWLFRLFSEPKRLWRRYLVEPLFLLAPAGRDIVSLIRRKVQKTA
jgi:N-acetylglucosaminyldiphosphoundecaprenol N-acetyl-beta-D-mannosaminyltransferase